jgi:hypothetical protein
VTIRPIPDGGLAGEPLREAASEFNAVTELVTAALRRHYGLGVNDYGIWPHSMYPDRVIVRRDGKLFEFPYTIDDANEVTLGAATEVMLETKAVAGKAKMREAAATEIGQIVEMVRTAIRSAARARGQSIESWNIRGVYADRAVAADADGRLYAYPYTIDDANVVTVDERYEVVLEHRPVKDTPTPEPIREAAPDSWFIEARKADGDKPSRYLVRVIQAGVSLNGVDYPAKVLREAAPLFDGVRVMVKPDAEHLKGGGKDLRQLVGRLGNAKFVETAGGGGEIQAEMDVLDSSSIAGQLREAVERGMTDLFGLSIDASGASKTKGKFREATRITKVDSVDLIIEPGAGGRVIKFLEAKQDNDTMLREQMLNDIRGRDPARAAALAGATDTEVLTAYREAFAGDAGNANPNANTGISLDDLHAHTRLVEARAEARVAVGTAKLPQAAKDRLITRFAEAKSADDISADKVKAAIDAELAYGANFRESVPVSGLGREFAQTPGETRAQTVTRLFDDFFAGKNQISFREAYVEVTGDVRCTGQLRDCDESRLREAAGDRFREAVSASTFGDILGDSITRRMLALYREDTRYSDWRDLCDVVPVRDFRTQERGRMGGYGNLPAVAENGSYDALTSPGDEKATYAATKRGGTETISLEAILNDDVGVIRRIPQKLAASAGRTLYEFVLGFLDSNAAIYDTVTLFHASHANLGTAALADATFAAARLRMLNQAEAGSSKRIGLVTRHVYVPNDLEETAFDMFVRGTNNDETFVQSRKPKVHVVPHWTDANNWYATADKGDVPLIEIGFLGGQEEPEIFIQDNPSQGSLFSNDQIKYKIRHVYGGAVMDYRGFQGSLVA